MSAGFTRVCGQFCLFAFLALPAAAIAQSGRPQHIQKLPRVLASPAGRIGSASLNDLLYYGGPVMSNVQVVVVFWTSSVDATEQSNATSFYPAVTVSPWMDILSEYYTAGRLGQDNNTPGTTQTIGHGSYAGSYTIVPSVCGSGGTCTLDDTQVQAELAAQITAGNLPAPQFDASANANTLYMTYFPPGVTITLQGSSSCQQFCAYHGTATYNSNPLIYGVAPDFSSVSSGCNPAGACGSSSTYIDNFDAVCSHELAESVTDADVGIAGAGFARPLAWYDVSTPGPSGSAGEIGDLCNGMDTTTTVSGNTFSVQQLWSNALGACVGSESPVQFATTTVLSSSSLGNPPQAKFRQNVAYTATVTSSAAAVTGGSVSFADGSKTLGSASLDSQGHATISAGHLTIGHHSISASYSGGGNFLGSTTKTPLDQYQSPKPH